MYEKNPNLPHLYINKIKSVFASYGRFDTGVLTHFWTDFGKYGGDRKVSVRRWNSRGRGGQNLPWLDSRASGTIDFEVMNFSRLEKKFREKAVGSPKKPTKMWNEKKSCF